MRMTSVLFVLASVLAVECMAAVPFAAVAASREAGKSSDAKPAASSFREELKKALEADPGLVMDVLRSQRKELIDILNQAAAEGQDRQRKEAELAVEKEIDERVANPYQPAVDGKTRVRGNKNAKHTLVEYSDFQCPYCARGFLIVEELRKKFGDDLRFVFKNKPLDMHPEAMPAARYLEAVSLQSPEKAWEFHDKLFMNQGKLGAAFYEETAKALGLNLKKLKKDVESQAVKDKVQADIAEADSFGFSGTPGFLFNGVPLRGAYPPVFFDKIVEKLQKKTGMAPQAPPQVQPQPAPKP
ncbi:MAG: thioredoxin domain-containing protein [Elusimicrobia bacterium]|nr:thioredoxin domain-containing protein [Elusimicrobiota bacterium]